MAKRSKSLKTFTPAFARAQAEFTTIVKSKIGWTMDTGPDGRPAPKQYAYADIADLLNMARPILASHGITVTQLPRIESTMMMLDTRLELDDEWMEAEYPVCVITAHPREIGAAITYARRYALAPMLGVAAEEDMDGAGAGSIDPLGLKIEPGPVTTTGSGGPPPAPREEATEDEEEPDPGSTVAAPVETPPTGLENAFADPEEVFQRAEEELGLMDTIADYDEAWAPFRKHQETMFPMDWDRLMSIGQKHRDRIETAEAAKPASSGRPGMNRAGQ
jgi:hypothetical protein